MLGGGSVKIWAIQMRPNTSLYYMFGLLVCSGFFPPQILNNFRSVKRFVPSFLLLYDCEMFLRDWARDPRANESFLPSMDWSTAWLWRGRQLILIILFIRTSSTGVHWYVQPIRSIWSGFCLNAANISRTLEIWGFRNKQYARDNVKSARKDWHPFILGRHYVRNIPINHCQVCV